MREGGKTYRVQEQIFRLQVPMHNMMEVAILHSRNNLVEEPSSLVRVQPAFRDNVVEELAVRHLIRRTGGREGGKEEEG